VKEASANPPMVSILIPVYNGADYLAEAIHSALNQTCKSEVIVVNDGSDDEGQTEKIALSFGDDIRYFSKDNGGVASALNWGIARMRGRYLSWLSHDDLYYPQKIEAQLEFIEQNDRRDMIIYSDFDIVEVNTGGVRTVRLPDIPAKHFKYHLTAGLAIHGCTLLIPMECFEYAQFDSKLRTTQDYDLWFRLAERYDFVHQSRVLVRARHHAKQGTRRLASVGMRERDRLMMKFVRELRPEEIAAATGSSLPVGYSRLSDSLNGRRFRRAARTALSFAYRTLSEGSSGTIFRLLRSTALFYAGSRLRRIFRIFRRKMKQAKRFVLGSRNPRKIFTRYYRENVFGGLESRSGGGSSLEQTETIRRLLPGVLEEFGVKSIVDAPCGDFYWMQHVPLGNVDYTGIDIVEALVQKNNVRFQTETRQFLCLDLSKSIVPRVDLVLCRDCLVHVPFKKALEVLRNFARSGSEYLLTTTFTSIKRNKEVGPRDIWRPLNLELPPFSFPPPIRLINEHCTEGDGRFRDKSLGLWRLKDLRFGGHSAVQIEA
jgi:glycosyltransferase involved in cell wall biosynthesis